MIVNFPSIVALTGAGISAESGLSTFRAKEGLWETHRIDEVATPDAFARDPALVHRFYNDRRLAALAAQPNAAHFALAELARVSAARGGQFTLVTQNVDDLHARAGSDAIQMHGSLLHMKCARCAAHWPETGDTDPKTPCPACGAPATRPDIVWFGEMPYQMDAIYGALEAADLFVSIGTSGTVYPAAGLAALARDLGIATLELNLERSGRVFDDCRLGPATRIVPDWVREITKA